MTMRDFPVLLSQIKFEVGLDKPIWVTKDGTKILVEDMETSHIQNCIICWNEESRISIFPISYLGGREKWLDIFNYELKKREEKLKKLGSLKK